MIQERKNDMASIIKRKKNYSVVYNYVDENGETKQKWETWHTHKEALKRKAEIENQQHTGTFLPPSNQTITEFLYDFVSLYGEKKWGVSMYDSQTALIANYINPIIGDMEVQAVTPRAVDGYIQTLQKTKSVSTKTRKAVTTYVSDKTIEKIIKLLRCAFKQAVRWEIIARNPFDNVILPKTEYAKRDIWTADMIRLALDKCTDSKLYVAMNLSFACSLRIIDLQTWERVQELRKQRKRPNRYDDVGLFSGLLFCADCGHVMYQQRYQTDKRKQDCYICGSYKKRTADCTAHFIRTDLLTAGVLDNLRKVTAYAQKHEARFVKLLIQQNEMGGKRKQAAATKQLEQVQSRIAELSHYIKRLYEDNVNGKINDERFMEMSADYEAEQRELKEKAAALQGELDKAQEATVNAEKFMNVVRKYLSIEELTHTLLREMVEKIVVYECEYDENEVRHQRIDIYYSFVGKIDLPEE